MGHSARAKNLAKCHDVAECHRLGAGWRYNPSKSYNYKLASNFTISKEGSGAVGLNAKRLGSVGQERLGAGTAVGQEPGRSRAGAGQTTALDKSHHFCAGASYGF